MMNGCSGGGRIIITTRPPSVIRTSAGRSSAVLTRVPKFYQAEKFRNLFHRPDKLANLLASAEPLKPQPKPGPQPQPENLLVPQAERGSKLEEPGPAAPPERINITEHLPPRVELQMAGIESTAGGKPACGACEAAGCGSPGATGRAWPYGSTITSSSRGTSRGTVRGAGERSSRRLRSGAM